LTDQLEREIPGICLDPILVDCSEVGPVEREVRERALTEKLRLAGLIVGPWQIAMAGEEVSGGVAQAVAGSPGRKLLAPLPTEGWDWAGVDRWDFEAMVRQTVRGVKQVLAGEEVKTQRPMGAGGVIGIILGILVLMILLAIPLFRFFIW
jgi:hypothetical protein